MVALTAVRTFATELYDVETRPQKVADTLLSLGADKVLSKVGLVDDADKIVTAVASMTTISGLIEKKESAMKLAAPYIAKVRDADGRKELKEDLVAAKQSGQAILTERVNGAVTKSKEFAAPYVAEAKKYTDPYAAKLAELRNSERVESMITAFQEVRASPRPATLIHPSTRCPSCSPPASPLRSASPSRPRLVSTRRRRFAPCATRRST